MAVSKRDFDGTQLAAAHIGDAVLDAIVGAANGSVTAAQADATQALADAAAADAKAVAADAKAVAAQVDADDVLYVDLIAAAEAANTIAVTAQLKDRNGANVAQALRCLATLYRKDGTIALVGAGRVTVAGGAPVSDNGKPNVIFTLDANGAATLTVTDVVGAINETFRLTVVPLEGIGAARSVDCPFDAA